jgi:hypothetical protein
MADPTYVIPGAAIHSFMMFAPFFALYEKKGMVIQGIFLFVFGPYLAGKKERGGRGRCIG